jgi:hypothetical protein
VSGLDSTSVACISLAFDASGTPVVAWDEATGNNAQGFPTGYGYFARRWNADSGSWDALGPNGGQVETRSSLYSPCQVPTSLAVDKLGRPVPAYSTENGLFVKRFENGSWSGVGPSGGLVGTPSFEGFSLALTSGNDPVLAWGDQESGSTRISRYDSKSSSWTAVGPDGGRVRAGGLAFSNPKLILDAADQPLLAGGVRVPYDAATTTGDVTLFRYSGSVWQEVGARAAGFGVAVGQVASVTLDASGTPVFAFVGSTAHGYNLYAQRFVGGVWQGVGAASGKVGANAIQHLSLLSDAAGTLHLSYQGIPPSVSVLRFP